MVVSADGTVMMAQGDIANGKNVSEECRSAPSGAEKLSAEDKGKLRGRPEAMYCRNTYNPTTHSIITELVLQAFDEPAGGLLPRPNVMGFLCLINQPVMDRIERQL